MTQRATWDETWEDVAGTIKWRSLCSKAKVGAVITDSDNRIVSTGYNGPPAEFVHTDLPCKHWCPRGADQDAGTVYPCYSVHAEANALLAGNRSTWQGGTMYVTKHPCLECAKLIANSGLARIVVTPDPPKIAEERHIAVYRFLQEECGIEIVLSMPAEVAPLLTPPAGWGESWGDGDGSAADR